MCDNGKIKDIQDYWTLADGRLYVLVKCEDGVVRSVIVEKKSIKDWWKK